MQSVLRVMWNKVERTLKDSQKISGRLEECSDSKGIKSELNGRTFKYYFGGVRFHMLPQSYTFSHGLCMNGFLQVWFICNEIYQFPPFRYINQDDKVSHLVIVMKVLGEKKSLMRSVK